MSYDGTALDGLNRARYVLGDTSNDAATELLTDDFIEAVLALYSFNASIVFMAQGLAARYAQLPTSVSANGKSVSWGERVKYWLLLVANGGQAGASGAFSVLPTRSDGYAELAAAE